MAGGHLKSTTVLYTAEIELRPTIGGTIGRKSDPETGAKLLDLTSDRLFIDGDSHICLFNI